MSSNAIVYSMFLIFSGAAFLATLMLYTRQSLMVAYMLLGVILGPWGLKWVNDAYLIKQIGDIGIIFLLFLLGLHLDPQNLWQMLKKATWVAIPSSFCFAVVGFLIADYFGFARQEAIVIGLSMMFSSTIIGLKLLPTTVLHHQHIGELMISVLLLQDLIAIMVLLWIHGSTIDGFGVTDIGAIVLSLPALLIFSFMFERYILLPLFTRYDRVKEYLFLLSIAWCLSMSELAQLVGLSSEVGAFIAGISIATSRISLYIAECLKPVRDFFLVMFFFSVGASFNLNYVAKIAVPALVMAAVMLALKPAVFRGLLQKVGEQVSTGWEVGVRLGQVSEFSLLVAYIASSVSLISDTASYLIQATAIISFLFSSYWVVLKYPTPISVSEQLRRD
jgi:Kef-type K+ transport system membrane component KefB